MSGEKAEVGQKKRSAEKKVAKAQSQLNCVSFFFFFGCRNGGIRHSRLKVRYITSFVLRLRVISCSSKPPRFPLISRCIDVDHIAVG